MPDSRILLGVIGRPHGVRGLVRVTSHTADPAALSAYGPVSDAHGRRRFVLMWHAPGVAEIAELIDGVPVKLPDRAAAERLTNTRLFIDRAALPDPEPDEFYLADLIGLAARSGGGVPIGTISAVHDYGAGTSLEIARDGGEPLLVPFTRAAVPQVDVAGGCVTVEAPVPVHISRLAGEVETRSVEGEGPTAETDRASCPSPASLPSATSPASGRGGR